jgi:hypothetical protein
VRKQESALRYFLAANPGVIRAAWDCSDSIPEFVDNPRTSRELPEKRIPKGPRALSRARTGRGSWMRSWLTRNEWVTCLMLGVGVATLVVVVRTLGGFQALELGEYDRIHSRLVAFERESEPSRAIVVGYSERDLTGEIGFPLSDEKLTAALEAILADGPRGIGVDFFRDLPIPPGSEELADLLQRDQRVVMIHQLATAHDRAVPPPDAIGPAQAGLADLVPDADGHVRRAIVYLDDQEFGTALSLALQLALRHLAVDGIGLSAAPSDEPRRLRPSRRCGVSDTHPICRCESWRGIGSYGRHAERIRAWPLSRPDGLHRGHRPHPYRSSIDAPG